MFAPAPSLSRICSRITLPFLLLTFGFAHELPVLAAKAPSNAESARARLASSYTAIPLSFELNQGQADRKVHYLSHGAGYSILFKDREAVLLLSKSRAEHKVPFQPGVREPEGPRVADSKVDVLGMQLSGGSAKQQLTGEARLQGTVNYFLGNNPANWKTGVPTFEKVKYTDVYPGVNLIYYGSHQRLEFDFEVAPGGDARQIQLRFDGAHKLNLDAEGNLTIVAGSGAISFHKPIVYQIAADNSRQPIAGSFQIFSRKTVGFSLGGYNHAKTLVIDPILNYSTYLGGSSEATAIAVDSAGDAYVTGGALQGMPASGIQSLPGTKTSSSFGSAFVFKFNSTGTALVYCVLSPALRN